MRSKSMLTEAKQISRAIALIGLGARLQVLESETDLSYERLLRLYKEVAGKSPSKKVPAASVLLERETGPSTDTATPGTTRVDNCARTEPRTAD